jgi:hypothetical protein
MVWYVGILALVGVMFLVTSAGPAGLNHRRISP